MRRLVCWYKQAAIVVLVFGIVQAAECQGLSVTGATVDSSGNILSVTDPPGIHAELPVGNKLYVGGSFNNVTFYSWDSVHG